MAGACASLLFPSEATEGVLASWEHIVSGRASSRSENDFSIRSGPEGAWPFFFEVVRRAEPEWHLEHDEDVSIADAFGFTPEVGIVFGAMCRGRESERILGELACALLAEHHGVMMFDGLLYLQDDRDAWHRWYSESDGRRATLSAQAIGPHPGKLAVTKLDGDPVCHVVDRAFLVFWMEHPAFHFVN